MTTAGNEVNPIGQSQREQQVLALAESLYATFFVHSGFTLPHGEEEAEDMAGRAYRFAGAFYRVADVLAERTRAAEATEAEEVPAVSGSQATPGPWEWDADGNLVTADGKPVLKAGIVSAGLEPGDPFIEMWDADADLIAAAPELYKLVTLIRDTDEDYKLKGLPRNLPSFVRAKVAAAIARAEGRD